MNTKKKIDCCCCVILYFVIRIIYLADFFLVFIVEMPTLAIHKHKHCITIPYMTMVVVGANDKQTWLKRTEIKIIVKNELEVHKIIRYTSLFKSVFFFHIEKRKQAICLLIGSFGDLCFWYKNAKHVCARALVRLYLIVPHRLKIIILRGLGPHFYIILVDLIWLFSSHAFFLSWQFEIHRPLSSIHGYKVW